MKVELDLYKRAVITTLLRREALSQILADNADMAREAGELAALANALEVWPEGPAPARVDGSRDLKV